MAVNTEYESLLHKVLYEGEDISGERTGVGTKSIFGARMVFDLSQGFPLVTTKKVFFRGVVEELLWFISGDTNSNTLSSKGIHIWDSWKKPFRSRFDSVVYVPRTNGLIDVESITTSTKGMALPEVKDYGDPVKNAWAVMLHNVGDDTGIYDRWLNFNDFAKDARSLPQYNYVEDGGNVLIPSYYPVRRDSGLPALVYAPDTTVWGAPEDYDKVVDSEIGVNGNYADAVRYPLISDGDLGAVYGAQWRSWGGKVDQLSNVIDSLKNDPMSRRHIISAWNVGELDNMALPPCHLLIQFRVSPDGKLDCQVYQRSADIFLGVPFNIASYALLVELMARETGLAAGKLVWVGGDVHLYSNHIQEGLEQLSREPYDMPTISIAPGKSIFDYTYDDIKIVGYTHHPPISVPVAV